MFNVKKILLLWKSENAVGIILCCIFSLISLYFLISVKPPSSKSNHPVIAQIKKFDPGSKQRLAGTISFIDIESNNKLQNNDEIYTGRNSKITIEFLNSKNQVIIPSGSLVRVENNVDGEVLEIKEGHVDITIKQGMAAKIISEGQTVQLTNTNAEEGTIRAFKVKDKITFNQIKSGNSDHEMKLMKIEEVESKLSPNSRSIEKSTKPQPPVLMESHFELQTPTENSKYGLREEIKFKWSGSEFVNVTMAKSQDQLFEGTTKKVKNSPALMSQELDLGSWYLGIESEKGEKTVVPIEIFNNYVITNAKPAHDEIVELPPDTPLVFTWSPLPAKSYEIFIRESNNNVSKIVTQTNTFQLEHPTGKYIEWSVTPILKDGSKAPSSKLMKFNLNFTGELKFTGKLLLSNIFQLSEKRIPLTWNLIALNKFSLFSENNEKILEKETRNNSLELATLKLGLYKIKLESIDYPTLKPAESTIEIHTPIIEWEPNNKNNFIAYDPKIEIPINFKSAVNGKENLIPVLNFKNVDLKTSEANIKVEKQKLIINLQQFGKYCVRIAPISVLKFYDESIPYCFEFNELLPFKTSPTLKPARLKHTFSDGFDAYTTSIAPVERAIKYHFEVYKDADMKNLIYETDSDKPNITWVTKRTGIFYYRYKVYDYKNRESSFSNLSKFILPISPFSKLKDD